MLTTFEADEYVFEALRVGASGFVLKDIEPTDLLQAVRGWRPQAGVKATRAIGSPGTCQFQEVPDARVETSIR